MIKTITFPSIPGRIYCHNGRVRQTGVEVCEIIGEFIGEINTQMVAIRDDGEPFAFITIPNSKRSDLCAAMLDIDPLKINLLSWMERKTIVTAEKYNKPLPGLDYVIRSVGRQVSILESPDGNIVEVQNGTIRIL